MEQVKEAVGVPVFLASAIAWSPAMTDTNRLTFSFTVGYPARTLVAKRELSARMAIK